MALYPLDAKDEVRECVRCKGDGREKTARHHALDYDACSVCFGTGQLGNPEALRVIRTSETPAGGWVADVLRQTVNGKRWRRASSAIFDTEPDALAAARKALGGKGR